MTFLSTPAADHATANHASPAWSNVSPGCTAQCWQTVRQANFCSAKPSPRSLVQHRQKIDPLWNYANLRGYYTSAACHTAAPQCSVSGLSAMEFLNGVDGDRAAAAREFF